MWSFTLHPSICSPRPLVSALTLWSPQCGIPGGICGADWHARWQARKAVVGHTSGGHTSGEHWVNTPLGRSSTFTTLAGSTSSQLRTGGAFTPFPSLSLGTLLELVSVFVRPVPSPTTRWVSNGVVGSQAFAAFDQGKASRVELSEAPELPAACSFVATSTEVPLDVTSFIAFGTTVGSLCMDGTSTGPTARGPQHRAHSTGPTAQGPQHRAHSFDLFDHQLRQ